jgi:tetratricopeptide (TPR) repeat protein
VHKQWPVRFKVKALSFKKTFGYGDSDAQLTPATAHAQTLAVIFDMNTRQTIFRIILLIFCNSSISFGQLKVYQDSLAYYSKAKNEVKMLLYLDKMLTLDPNSTYLLLHKGALLHDLKKYQEAIETFSKALLINPNITDAYVRRGISYLGLHNYDSSILSFNRAIGKYRYQDSVIFKYRALAYLAKNQVALAKSDYDSAIKFNERDKHLLNNRALVKIELMDLNGALDDLNRAINEDKNYLNAIKNRAIVNSQIGDIENALKDSNHYLKYYPLDEHINLIVGAISFDKKEYTTALQYLNKCKVNLKTKEVYKLSGMSNYFLVQDKQAINDLTQLLEFDLTQSEEAEAYYIIGICKNNITPKSGCRDIKIAIEKGQADARRNYTEECE